MGSIYSEYVEFNCPDVCEFILDYSGRKKCNNSHLVRIVEQRDNDCDVFTFEVLSGESSTPEYYHFSHKLFNAMMKAYNSHVCKLSGEE